LIKILNKIALIIRVSTPKKTSLDRHFAPAARYFDGAPHASQTAPNLRQ